MKPQGYPTDPEYLWSLFYDFTQTPRPSKCEGKIREYLINLATNNELKFKEDKVGNIIIYVPGKNGREAHEPVIIQNHIDMVTDALPSKKINFKEDPINTIVKNGWLHADGTTLGADNGIGCAAALATIFDKSISHPPLELLFTVDEETGLHGALGLETSYLSAKKMLNLDTEEWGSIYIGCAGGIDYELEGKLDFTSSSLANSFRIEISGLVGGHSGLDIHEQRGSAIVLLGELLSHIRKKSTIQLAEFRGGRAHNIIPRDAFCDFSTDTLSIDDIDVIKDQFLSQIRSYLPKIDSGLKITIEPSNLKSNSLNAKDTDSIIDYLNLFPHGAHKYDLVERALPATSNNFAKFLMINGAIYTQTSLRFFDREEVRELEGRIEILARTFGMELKRNSEYPSWKPNWDNKLLDKVVDLYERRFEVKPEVKAIHAGLECGILKDKIGAIDIVSFGPTIMGAHSPDERVDIDSVKSFWNFFKEVLKEI